MKNLTTYENFISEQKSTTYYFSYIDNTEKKIVDESVILFSRFADKFLKSLQSKPKRFEIIKMTTDEDEHKKNIAALQSQMKNQY